MSNLKRYVPFSILSFSAAVIAMGLAWEPSEAEANRPPADEPLLRSSIIETGRIVAPQCPDAVWPHVTNDCLLFPDLKTAERPVRTIVIDDRTIDANRAVLDRIAVGIKTKL